MNKSYVITKQNNLFNIKWAGGGQMPTPLKGLFTSIKEAELSIKNYEDSSAARRKTKRKVKDAETEG